MIGAANVSTGKLTKSASIHQPIWVTHILTSCSVPKIFRVVQIDDGGYWDHLFSDNPPLQELMQPDSIGAENLPEEIWLIKIDPATCEQIPELPDHIVDRRNQLERNISMFQQLRHLEMMINDRLPQDAFQPDYLAKFDIKAPVRIPRSFPTDLPRRYHIPCIEMPADPEEMLGFESKLDRSSFNIERLTGKARRAPSASCKNVQRLFPANPP
jgi:NTE family protein